MPISKPSSNMKTRREKMRSKKDSSKGGKRFRAFVAFQPFPNDPILKIERIMILDNQNRIVQDFEGPSPISDFIGTSDSTTIKKLLQQRLLEIFEIRAKLSDIHLVSFPELTKLLFKLHN